MLTPTNLSHHAMHTDSIHSYIEHDYTGILSSLHWLQSNWCADIEHVWSSYRMSGQPFILHCVQTAVSLCPVPIDRAIYKCVSIWHVWYGAEASLQSPHPSNKRESPHDCRWPVGCCYPVTGTAATTASTVCCRSYIIKFIIENWS